MWFHLGMPETAQSVLLSMSLPSDEEDELPLAMLATKKSVEDHDNLWIGYNTNKVYLNFKFVLFSVLDSIKD